MAMECTSTFSLHFIEANRLGGGAFHEWILTPGMLFEAADMWWGKQNKRKSPHQGIDLGLYRNRDLKIKEVKANTRIPAICDGVIAAIFNDFLGQSVFTRHKIRDRKNRALCSIFGHIQPHDDMYPGRIIKAGEIIGNITDTGSSAVKPHLHLTMAWIEGEITADLLDWNNIGQSQKLELVDPIEIIGRYSIIPASALL